MSRRETTKYYHYLSTSKIDMLFAQVPRSLREKVSAEFGFNVGLVSGSVRAEANRFDEPIARLQAVERYLIATNEIGTVEQPRDWFAGEMRSQATGLWSGGGAVFFVGNVGDTIVGLGGSERNMLGVKESSSEGPAYSDAGPMMKALEALVVSETPDDAKLDHVTEDGGYQAWTWDDLFRLIVRNRPYGVEQSLHFVARLLATASVPSRVILGTPLYVAGGTAAAE